MCDKRHGGYCKLSMHSDANHDPNVKWVDTGGEVHGGSRIWVFTSQSELDFIGHRVNVLIDRTIIITYYSYYFA